MNSLIGTVLSDKYELIELIGTGGMADVYKGRDTRLSRNVAVKVLKQEFNNDQEFIKRFQTESRAIASLSHANIVNIYDVGFEDDLNYIVMELVTGNTLKDYLDSIPGFMKEEAVINIAIQICSALAQAHSKQVVHRDIKAQNILIDTDGRIKVADFGIARAAHNQTIVKSDEVFGSVHYASPEQARGKNVDRRSDIYSLGILLYELLTRELPFDSDSAVSVAMMQMKAKMPDPRDKNPAISGGMAKIIAIATRKSPGERYQNAYEMISDLRKLKNDPEYIPIEKTIINDAEVMNELFTEDNSAYNYEVEGSETTKTGYMIAGILGAALAVVIAVVLLLQIISYQNARSIVEMPNIINAELNAGTNMLAELGVKAEVAEVRSSEDVPKGHIISASIEEGEKIKRGFTVKLVVSSGAELVRIPKLTELPREKAEELITKEGFIVGTVSQEYSALPAGYVVSQSPEADAMMEKNTMIDIVISLGEKQELVFVPALSGLTLREADAALMRNGLKMGEVVREYNSEVAKDVVISSELKGERVEPGTRINVLVSDGPDPQATTEPTSESTENSSETSSESSTSGSESGGDAVTVNMTVNILAANFEDKKTLIRIELLNNDEKSIVYQAEHSVDEGDVIPVNISVTGSGAGKLLIRYDSFVKEEIDFVFE